jgi:hypothetical protein
MLIKSLPSRKLLPLISYKFFLKIFAAIAVVVCVVVLILVNREAEDETPSTGSISSVPPPPLPAVEEGRKSPKTPIFPVARGVSKLGSPFTPEIEPIEPGTLKENGLDVSGAGRQGLVDETETIFGALAAGGLGAGGGGDG